MQRQYVPSLPSSELAAALGQNLRSAEPQYLFCTESTARSAQKATQAVYAEVLKYPGKPMVNSVVSTKASSIDQQLQCGSCWVRARATTGRCALPLQFALTDSSLPVHSLLPDRRKPRSARSRFS